MVVPNRSKDFYSMHIFKSVLLLIIAVSQAVALDCYACNWAPGVTECLDNANSSQITNCSVNAGEDEKWCLVHHLYVKEESEEPYETYSFGRLCAVPDPSFGECMPALDGLQCTCRTKCNTDLCNDGDGLPNKYKSPCVEKGNAAFKTQAHYFLYALALVFLYTINS